MKQVFKMSLIFTHCFLLLSQVTIPQENIHIYTVIVRIYLNIFFAFNLVAAEFHYPDIKDEPHYKPGFEYHFYYESNTN
eukprot:snap_masked-scaffold_3-processed-gene-8.15-mRNA-1 protein AED:1.00 eAED:1.00 QI:0/0/0/0/1/1/3/0/78